MEILLPIPELPEPQLVRFWSFVDQSPGCWIWTAKCSDTGHGEFSIGGRTGHVYYAHRVSWAIHFGPIPEGLYVLHNCPGGDNPRCVNPAHLYLGTKADNARDAYEKGQSWQSRTTHCPNGHPYEGDNLYVDPTGKRNCQACRRENERRYRIAHGKARPSDLAAMALPDEAARLLPEAAKDDLNEARRHLARRRGLLS